MLFKEEAVTASLHLFWIDLFLRREGKQIKRCVVSSFLTCYNCSVNTIASKGDEGDASRITYAFAQLFTLFFK